MLIAAPRFRGFWFALLCNNLGSWCVIATLPILGAERFGASMMLEPWFAKVILAPAAGIPEIISTPAWFTALQGRMVPSQQALFFPFAAPAIGPVFRAWHRLRSLHAEGMLSLSA